MLLFPLLLSTVLAVRQEGEGRILDDFRYGDATAARQAWTAAEGTPAATIVPPPNGPALEVGAPFAARPTLIRTVIDRQVRLDLSSPVEFVLEIAVEPPEAAGHVTLYFHSGAGWYGSSLPLAEKGWQSLRFAKRSFRPEERPGGWDHIEGIRIAVWRGNRQDAAVRLRRLSALGPEALRAEHQAARDRAAHQPPGRAMWNHSGTGAYPGDWPRTTGLLAKSGFNMVLPNMLWAGVAHYASDVLPRSETFRRYGDQIAQCVAAARNRGLAVHVWKVDYNLATAPPGFVAELRRQGRTQVAVDRRNVDWLCPSHPENQRLELASLLEVARNYDVAGLHLDYIRYPNRESCYCDGCRRRFEADSGRPVKDWPEECYSGSRKEEYNDWRCRQITALVAAVRRESKRLRPGLKLSAAVFGAYPDCRRSVAQDWPQWVRDGLLDFVCPMDYSNDDAQFAEWVEGQVRLVGGRVPVYAGIGATASRSTLPVEQVVGQIERARSLGAAGFSIFNLDGRTAESLVPGVGLKLRSAGIKEP